MSKYIIRLDDASEYMNENKWRKIEKLLYKYNVHPLVGVIPNNKDKDLILKYNKNILFWDKVHEWVEKGWIIAMHGYTHEFCDFSYDGLNPINKYSEFVNLTYEEQKTKILNGLKIFNENGVDVKVFFAPAHTFDVNTIKVLVNETNIRFISDTIANNIYKKDGITFVPQQSGKVRKLPFKIVTFCYHPNNMNDKDFELLEKFLLKNRKKFIDFPIIEASKKESYYDLFLKNVYFGLKRIKGFRNEKK